MRTLIRLGSITDVLPHHAGSVAVCGSHGGLFPAALASQAGLCGAIFNDAGRGLDDAGVAGVMNLAQAGFAAAAADYMSCQIGSAEDMMVNGVISTVNSVAAELGLESGQSVSHAGSLLQHCVCPASRLPAVAEKRRTHHLSNGIRLELIDSASLVEPDDAGRIVLTGSHGGLIGGDPARALKAQARLAIFNDAGGGCKGAGFTRLPALEQRGVAALTVAHSSARIGNAQAALETGAVSRVNKLARELDMRSGDSLKFCLMRLRSI